MLSQARPQRIDRWDMKLLTYLVVIWILNSLLTLSYHIVVIVYLHNTQDEAHSPGRFLWHTSTSRGTCNYQRPLLWERCPQRRVYTSTRTSVRANIRRQHLKDHCSYDGDDILCYSITARCPGKDASTLCTWTNRYKDFWEGKPRARKSKLKSWPPGWFKVFNWDISLTVTI